MLRQIGKQPPLKLKFVFLVVRKVVLGRSWKPDTTLRACGPKSCKQLENERPRPLFGALWAPIDRSGEGLNRLADSLEVLECHFIKYLLEKRDLYRSVLLRIRSVTFASPGAQV